MFKTKPALFILLSLLFLPMAHWGAAQTTTAALVGTVKDETQAILPGVSLTIKNMGTGAIRTVVTGLNRSVSLSDVDEEAARKVNPALSFLPGEIFGSITFGQPGGGLASISGISAGNPTPFHWNSFQYFDDFSYSSGRNSTRVGASVDRLQHNFSQPTFLRGQYSFTNLRDFLQGRASQFQGFFPGSIILRGMRTTMKQQPCPGRGRPVVGWIRF